MRSEYEVQLGKHRVASVLRAQITPAVLIVQTETQKLAEVIRKIRSHTLPLQGRIIQDICLIPAHTGVFAAVELPLPEKRVSERFPLAGERALQSRRYLKR